MLLVLGRPIGLGGARRAALAGVLVGLLFAIPATAVAAVPGWTPQPTTVPAGGDGAALESVACPTASFCVAVGNFKDRSDTPAALYATSDGTTWSPERELLPAGALSADLVSVSCTSPSQCVAVGFYFDSTGVRHPLAEHWDGTRWTRENAPVAGPGTVNGLFGVDCVTSVSCFAVGSTDNGPIVDHWNGTAWSSQTVVPSSIRGELLSVSCTSGTSCLAVGSYPDTGGHQQPSAALLSGSSWTLQAVPAASGSDTSELNSVSCPVSGDCVAVGNASNGSEARGFSTEWNGSVWTEGAIPAPAGATGAFLNGVSCVSATVCTAVGSYGESGGNALLADRWDGSSWVLQPVAGPAAPQPVFDAGVSCPTTLLCTAVGATADGSGHQVTLAEGWGGPAWASLSIPSPPTMKFAQLFSTSCPDVNSCVAVGQFDRSSDGAVVAFGEAWNGSGWRILPRVPLPAGAGNATLLGVSCPLAGQCVAVGSYTRVADSHVLPLAVGWNGHAWTLISSAGPSASYSQLDGVWCKSISSCETVGFSIPSAASGVSVPLVEQLSDGTTIVLRVPSPPQNAGSALHGVSCDPSLNCVAVGNSDQGHGEMALSYRLPASGTWTIMNNPNAGEGAGEDDLFGVSCLTFTSCIAAGAQQVSNETPLAQRLSATTWTDVTPRHPTNAAFKAISCPHANACTAVGYRTTSTQTLTLAERWNGTTWSTQTTPSPGTDNILYGTACPTLNTCIAVGTIANTHTPLAEIYS
jgi:hypothetical protein